MPPRTNAFQKLIVLLHQSLGPDTVIESKMFHDVAGETDREVDICVYKRTLGRESHVAIECVDWNVPADITWVEQQLGKHRDIPTSALILVSANGFTKSARKKAAHYGVSLIIPEADAEWGGEALKRLQDRYLAYIALSVLRCTVTVIVDDEVEKRVPVEPDFAIYDSGGSYIGANMGLFVATWLDNDSLRRHLILAVGAHPEAEFFQVSTTEPIAPSPTLIVSFPVAGHAPDAAPLCDRIAHGAGFFQNEGKLERIVNVHVVGKIQCIQGPAKMKMGVINGKRVFWGSATVAGQVVLVAAVDHRSLPDDRADERSR
jgi:hypothetical protein